MTNQKEHNPNYGVTLQQVMELWIIPEIKKRQDEGTIPTEPPYTLHKAQVLIGADGTKIVRLNNEVKILAKAKTTKPITKGQVLYESDIETIEELLLIEEERDLGHFTFIKFKNSWILAFSFIYDTSKAI